MQEIVINGIYGCFELSNEALARYEELSGKVNVCNCDIKRDDKYLIKVVKELGSKANGRLANLKIVEVPDGVKWSIEEYDDMEWIAEVHRIWK